MEKIIYDELEFCEDCGCLEKEHYIVDIGGMKCSICKSCLKDLQKEIEKILK